MLLCQKVLLSQEYIRITLLQGIQGKSNWKNTALYLLQSQAKYILQLRIGKIISHVSMIWLFLIWIFDRYFDSSLKEATQNSRGTGTRLKTAGLLEIWILKFFFTLARKKLSKWISCRLWCIMETRYYLARTRKLFCLCIKKKLKTTMKLLSQHANPKNLTKG